MTSRRSQLALCAALVAGAAFSAFAIEYNEFRLDARLDGDFLHVSAPNFSFLKGKSLQRLKDGASVAFIAQLTVSNSPNYVMADASTVARFAISYDIWGERFSVTRITGRPDQKRTVSHLDGAAAEAWCLDNLTIRRGSLPADKPFYLQLDLRVEDPRDAAGVIGEGGISLSRMVEIFSRPVRDKQDHWLLSSGPVKLDDLIKKGAARVTLRTRLALVFIGATLVPLGPTIWLTTNLFEQSLAPVDQLGSVSRALETTGRQYYKEASERLKEDAQAGRIAPKVYSDLNAAGLPDAIREFRDSNEYERFSHTGDGGSELRYMVRNGNSVSVWERPLGIRMDDLSRQYSHARNTVTQDLRRGYFATWGLLVTLIWLVALALVWVVATRFSRPIVNLTEALRGLAGGDFRIRVPNDRNDEIGLATQAFNRTATQLEQSRDRLVYLTQLASWQILARKMAHEVKNSLTPIRLTVEEMVARESETSAAGRRAFLEQAASIVVDEIESLERRIRAFSDFSSEPPVCPETLDLNALVEERIAFLKTAHPEVGYLVEAAAHAPAAMADQDLVKGILVNLLENAAEAAGEGGRILAKVVAMDDRVAIEVHDSGPGLSEMARKSLFQPTISFKKRGMGLGLSIARKSALLSGGDILLIAGELGGAGFRVLLPAGGESGGPESGGADHASAAHSGR